MSTSPFSLDARETQPHLGCQHQQCRLSTEPHQSPIRIKAWERARTGLTLAPGTSVPQTTVGTRASPLHKEVAPVD
jgi:hypothetical protein